MNKETITISREEYESLIDSAAHLDVLESRGVDNWVGYVGPYTFCRECDEEEISWAEEKCPRCGSEIIDDFY